MANLKRTHHQLAKAEKKLRKYSRSQKQFQIQFVRKQRKIGKIQNNCPYPTWRKKQPIYRTWSDSQDSESQNEIYRR